MDNCIPYTANRLDAGLRSLRQQPTLVKGLNALVSLPSIQRSRSLYEQTYEALRASILSGELAPGARLIETQLAEQLRVSRTPIREAMRQLQRETLVTADASGGLRVATVSATDASQLYDCRIALEQLSVRGACQNATPAQLQALAAIVSQAETLVNNAQPRSPEMLDLDYRFHLAIATSSGNQWLVFLLEQVFSQMTLLRVQTTRHNPRVLEIRSEHRHIYEAIAQAHASGSENDRETAVTAIARHLHASRQRVVQEVEQMQQAIEPS